MSMHKQPLTPIEETGLIAHGFGRDIGKPSMAADIFRHGVAWGQMSVADQIASIQKQIEHEMPFDKKLRDRFAELLAVLQAQQPPTKDHICGKCGYECNIVRKELDTFTSHDMQSGRLLERKYIVADVTSCCQDQGFYHKDDPDDAEPKSRQYGDEVHWIAPLRTMSIQAAPGTAIKFGDVNGTPYQQMRAREHLNTETVYHVKSIEVGSTCSFVTLKEFPDMEFNTVMFHEVDA